MASILKASIISASEYGHIFASRAAAEPYDGVIKGGGGDVLRFCAFLVFECV